jgi:hypothetical protein
MHIEGSSAPFPDEREQGVEMTCDNGHSSRIYLKGTTLEMATDYAGMIDGTHTMFGEPLKGQRAPWGHCQICGALVRARPFGYEEPNGHG